MSKIDKSKVLGNFNPGPVIKKKKTLNDAPVSEIHQGKLQKSTVQFPEELHMKIKLRSLKLKVTFRALLIEYLEKAVASDDRFED